MTANLVLSGGPSHDFAGTTGALVRTLAEVGVRSTVIDDPRAAFAELAAPDSAWDMVTVNALWWRMEIDRYADQRARWAFSIRDDEAAALDAFVRVGGGLLACHTAAICFDAHPLWAAAIGATWSWERSSHPPLGPVRIAPTPAGAVHPITRGIEAFTTVDEVYGHLDQADDELVPLLTGRHGDTDQPVLWARPVGDGRVVTDLLGHDETAVDHPEHRAILQRAARWLTAERSSVTP